MEYYFKILEKYTNKFFTYVEVYLRLLALKKENLQSLMSLRWQFDCYIIKDLSQEGATVHEEHEQVIVDESIAIFSGDKDQPETFIKEIASC